MVDTPFAPDDNKFKKSNEDFLEGLDEQKNLNLTGNLISKQLKIMRLAEDIQPGLI